MNCNLYSNNRNLHILTKKRLNSNPFEEWEKINKRILIVRGLYKIIRFVENKFNKESNKVYIESFLMKDFEYVKNKINRK